MLSVVEMLACPSCSCAICTGTRQRQYNDTFQSSYDHPRNDQVLRVDWNVAPKTTFHSRLNFLYEAYKRGWGFVLNKANWPQLPIAYQIRRRYS
jgi:hypothetical protein